MCDKHPWSLFEDEALASAINELQPNVQWIKVEKILKVKYGIKNRSGKQCRERWCNNLDPNCRKREWTEEEDAIIFNYQQKIGNNWSKISQFLVGRSDNTIKNHFYATIRRKLRRYNKLNTEKINQSLKDIINDKELVRFLMEIPEKKKENGDKEVRRSARLSSKPKMEEKDGKSQERKNNSSSSLNQNSKPESSESIYNDSENEFTSYMNESPSNLLQLSTFNLVQDHQTPFSIMPHQSSYQSQFFPSFSLSTSFQYHALDQANPLDLPSSPILK